MSRGLSGSISDRDACGGRLGAGEAQVAHVGRASAARRSAASAPSGSKPAITCSRGQRERLRVTQMHVTMPAANSCSRPGIDARPRSPARPIAGRRVDEHDLSSMLRDARRDFLRLEVVRKREFDRAESACAASPNRSRNGASVKR